MRRRPNAASVDNIADALCRMAPQVGRRGAVMIRGVEADFGAVAKEIYGCEGKPVAWGVQYPEPADPQFY